MVQFASRAVTPLVDGPKAEWLKVLQQEGIRARFKGRNREDLRVMIVRSEMQNQSRTG